MNNAWLPARAAGMLAVFVRRGPWGWMHAEKAGIESAHMRLEGLMELPDALQRVAYSKTV